MNTKQLLIVEDAVDLAETLKSGLEEEGFEVTLAGEAERALELTAAQHFDLILLDLGLPGRDGMEVLRELRRQERTVPVIILTARDELPDRVKGLQRGADDYVVKPFAFAELVARIQAVLRRTHDEQRALAVGDAEVDLINRRVVRGELSIDLTQREFELLVYFARHAGRVVSRDTLSREVWRVQSRATPLDNVIDVNMSRLRAKLNEISDKDLLQTVRGVGYVLRELS